MFVATHTSSVIEAMGIRNYVILKLKIQCLSATLDVLRSNYEFQCQNFYNDQAVITQLSYGLRTLGDAVFVVDE